MLTAARVEPADKRFEALAVVHCIRSLLLLPSFALPFTIITRWRQQASSAVLPDI
jgi:hypothetical protein